MLGTLPKVLFKAATIPNGIFPSGNFPREFFQAEPSQGYFPYWQLLKCTIFQAATFKFVPVAALGP